MAGGRTRSRRYIRRCDDPRIQLTHSVIDVLGLEYEEVVEHSVVDETDDRLPLLVRKALYVNTTDPKRSRPLLPPGGRFLPNY
jgi:hypothetical protein